MTERRLPERPFTGKELGLGLMTAALGYVLTDFVDRMIAHRTPILDHVRGTFDETLFPNVAAMERAFGLLNEAPLSAEQASQERISRARRNTP